MEDSRPARTFKVVLIAIAGVGVLTAFAAWLPVEAKKLLLFSVAFGLCAGGVVLWTAREFGLERRAAGALTVPLVVIGLTLIALRGHQQLRSEIEAARDTPEHKMALNILQAAAEGDPELASELAERDPQTEPSFADYLAVRVQPLGEWRQPWPILFWGAEGLLAAAAGAFLVSRRLHTRHHPTEERP